jgi:dTDP-4-dehydrorhamnose reductase
MRVAVVGARGQLGAAVVHEFAAAHDVTAFDRAALDITRAASVEEGISRVKPAVIVNCAAYNAVDAAEDRPVEALQVNAFGVRALARAARAHGATLVHFSSDFVFDGTAESPYTEEDPPNPQSVYAASKLLGEWFASDAPRAYVLRVESLFGRAPGAAAARGSLAAIISTLAAGGTARVFEDRVVSPTNILDAARATRELVECSAPAGLYHCVNSGHGTWLELAREAARLLGVEPRLEPVRVSQVTLRAPRPKYCALSNAKLASAGIRMPPWQEALARHLRSVRDELAH